jgi:peptide/nickel transport system substrate-binding protein
MTKKLLSILLICFVLAALASGCGGTNPANPKPAEKELVIADREIAASLDPVQSPVSASFLKKIGVGEALFLVDQEGEVLPSLAESATEVDATTWRIKLRPNVRFWSGKAVDADAVIASLERSRALDLKALPFLDELVFTKLDDSTIQVKTKREYLPVPLNLSYYQTLILNAEAKQDSVETMDFTGMYKVVDYIPEQKMVLEINENYWGKKPAIKKVVHELIADEQTRVLAVLSGRCHVALNIPVASLDQFKDSKEVKISAIPPATTQTIYLNLSKPHFQDVKVRQALSWALDRDELVTLAAEGQSTPVTTWLGSNPAFPEAKNAVYTKFDPEKASQLLDEAGWITGSDGIRYKDGKPLTFRLLTWGSEKALGEALQNQWTRVGIKTEVQHGEYSLLQTARDSGEWDALIEAWSTFGDAYSLLRGQYGPEGAANYGGYNDEETNALLAQLAKASDEATRHALALKVNERVARQAPVICLYPRPEITAVSASLKGFEGHFRQFENVVTANLSF